MAGKQESHVYGNTSTNHSCVLFYMKLKAITFSEFVTTCALEVTFSEEEIHGEEN